MFSLKVVDTDLFLDMPMTSQLLYFHLCMRADDDGFVNSPKKILKMIGCNDDDLKILMAKVFVIPFESGVCVIRDWKIHNYIQKDRYSETLYTKEKSLLVEGKNGEYTKCIQNVSNMDTQVRDRLGKDRLGKDSIIEEKKLAVVKKPTTPQAKFLESFSSLYESQTGYKFKSDKKHFIIIATLIKKYSYDEIVEKAKLLAIYCKQGEFWFVKEGWSCFTPETLSNHWNRIIPILTKEQKKKQSSKNNYDELKEQRRKTDELIKNTTKSITA